MPPTRTTSRWLAGLSVFVLLATALVLPAQAQDAGPFPDVSSDHENITAIQFMKDNGVFEGYPDGNYQPDWVLNRAEQLKVYMLLHGMAPSVDDYNNCFPDVTDDWYAPYVCFAKEQGWVQGYPDGFFRPAQSVNKVEALKMLGEIQGWDVTTQTEDPFTDTPAEEWYAPYVAFAKEAGLLTEEGDTFDPAGGLTRALTAELLFRSLAVYGLGEEAYIEDLDDEIIMLDLEELAPVDVDDIPNTAPVAEYGDAPDGSLAGYAGSYSTVVGNFPTLFDTTNSTYGPGAYALDSGMEWLGDPDDGDFFSYEEDADDAADPDGTDNLDNEDDYDDGVTGLNITLISIPPPATLTLDVTVEEDAPDVTRYVNVLIDLDMDGTWGGTAAGGEPEWVVQNLAVNVAPDTTSTITSEPFAYSNGMILTPTSWMRVVLSRESIDSGDYGVDGWDGSGAFEYGEVEDYYLQLPDWDDGEGGSGGGAGGPGAGGRGLVWGKPAPVMVCPTTVRFPDDVDEIFFSCGIYNFGGRGDVEYTLTRLTGGVGVELTNAVRTVATAPPGFGGFGVVGNPIREWFKATRGDMPSTWEYLIEGVDPESTVEDSIVDLGLVPDEVEEGFGGDADYDDYEHWASLIGDYYLFGESAGPMLVGATFFHVGESDGMDLYNVMAHVRNSDENAEHEFTWTLEDDCGELSESSEADNMVEWWIEPGSAETCLESGLSVMVTDGFYTDEMDLTGIFNDLDITEIEVNEPPVIDGIFSEWANSLEDDPHIYYITVDAEDPEGGDLLYDWTEVTCGDLVSGTDSQTVEWQYALADMEECGSAEITIEVTDEEGDSVEETFDIF